MSTRSTRPVRSASLPMGSCTSAAGWRSLVLICKRPPRPFRLEHPLRENRMWAVAYLLDDSHGIGSDAAKLVDETNPRNGVTPHLAIYSDGLQDAAATADCQHHVYAARSQVTSWWHIYLALDPTHAAQHHDCAVQHPQSPLDFHCEVDVTCTRAHGEVQHALVTSATAMLSYQACQSR